MPLLRLFLLCCMIFGLTACDSLALTQILVASITPNEPGGFWAIKNRGLEKIEVQDNAFNSILFGRVSDSEAMGAMSWGTDPSDFTTTVMILDASGAVVSKSDPLPYSLNGPFFLAPQAREVVLSVNPQNFVGGSPPTWIRVNGDDGSHEVVPDVTQVIGFSGDGEVLLSRNENSGDAEIIAPDGQRTPAQFDPAFRPTEVGALNEDGSRFYHAPGSKFNFTLGHTEIATGTFVELLPSGQEASLFPDHLHFENNALVIRNSAETNVLPLEGGDVIPVTGSSGPLGVAGLSGDQTKFLTGRWDDFENANDYRLYEVGPEARDGTVPGTPILLDPIDLSSSAIF